MTRFVYILAASHSGSTLLSMLLGSHEQVATVGELKLSHEALGNLACYRCSCGELIQECGFWKEVKESMKVRGFEFDLAGAGTDYSAAESWYSRRLLAPMHKGKLFEVVRDAALGLSSQWRRRLPETHGRNAALAATVAEITGAKVVVDSSKTAVRLKYLLRNPELDVRVIRLIRDGRGVALTYMDPAGFADAKDPSLRGGGNGGNREKERLSMAQAAYEWRRDNQEAEHVLRNLDRSRWVEVRYEELCRDPENTLEGLFTFLGVESDKRIQDFRSVPSHVVGNGMRLDATSQISLDERWRSVLTDEDLRAFNREAGQMNRRYGYR